MLRGSPNRPMQSPIRNTSSGITPWATTARPSWGIAKGPASGGARSTKPRSSVATSGSSLAESGSGSHNGSGKARRGHLRAPPITWAVKLPHHPVRHEHMALFGISPSNFQGCKPKVTQGTGNPSHSSHIIWRCSWCDHQKPEPPSNLHQKWEEVPPTSRGFTIDGLFERFCG